MIKICYFHVFGHSGKIPGFVSRSRGGGLVVVKNTIVLGDLPKEVSDIDFDGDMGMGLEQIRK